MIFSCLQRYHICHDSARNVVFNRLLTAMLMQVEGLLFCVSAATHIAAAERLW